MEKNEILKYVSVIVDAFKTIPADAFRNPITYKSVLDNEIMRNKGFHDELMCPAGMIPRKECGEIYVGFYPVYFYDDCSVGILAAYYSTKTKSTAKFGPFKTAEDFTEEFCQYEGTPIYSYICKNLKLYSEFVVTYDNVLMNFQNRISEYRTLPLAYYRDDVDFMGTAVTIATEYILNPYCYDAPKVKYVYFDEFRQRVYETIEDVLPSTFSKEELWEHIDNERVNSIILRVKKSIYDRRECEDKIISDFINGTEEQLYS